MKRVYQLLAGVVLAGASAAPSLGDTWIEALRGHDIVILGEIHDNPDHHRNQAAALMGIAPSAVVFEMLTSAQADALSGGVPASATEAEELLEWSRSGWPDYALYDPVFQAIGEAAIYGAALPRDQVRAAVFGDITALFGEGAATFGLDAPLPRLEQAAREAMQMEAHCDAMPEEMLPGMVAAQRLRDAHFARVTLQALSETGGPVAVITGNGHAREDWGMPVYLGVAAPDTTLVTLGQFEAEPAPDAPFDVTLVADAPARDDPCAAFR